MGRSRNGDPRTRMRLALTEQTVGPVGDGTGTTVLIRCVARAARGERDRAPSASTAIPVKRAQSRRRTQFTDIASGSRADTHTRLAQMLPSCKKVTQRSRARTERSHLRFLANLFTRSMNSDFRPRHRMPDAPQSIDLSCLKRPTCPRACSLFARDPRDRPCKCAAR